MRLYRHISDNLNGLASADYKNPESTVQSSR